jgi:hypothetical protein
MWSSKPVPAGDLMRRNSTTIHYDVGADLPYFAGIGAQADNVFGAIGVTSRKCPPGIWAR